MLERKAKICVVMPCYKSSEFVLVVISKIPADVHKVYCVDDACPQNTGKLIQEQCEDKRVSVLFHSENQGVGGAMVTGYKQAIADKMDIVVKLDSDGQMDPTLIPRFVRPIQNGTADYTKGNRFFSPEFLTGMPTTRLLGNAALSFLNKFSSGYWRIFDPTNGYTAIHTDVLRFLPLDKINKGYFFESDMLFRLGTIRALVVDIPQKAIYGTEESNLNISHTLWTFAGYHVRNFFKRLTYNYYIRDFQLASIQWILGPLMLIFSFIFGINAWSASVESGVSASAGTVMLAALPIIVGLQLTLSALHFDIQNQPSVPIHGLIKGMSDT